MRVLLLTMIAWTATGWAQDAQPPTSPSPEERAKALHAEADAKRAEAETRFAADNTACWDKFLVSKCLDEAKKSKNDALAAARRLDQEARMIEREKRHSDFAEREARRTEEEPKRAAEAAAQAEKNRQAREEALERLEKKRIEAEQRERRKAAE